MEKIDKYFETKPSCLKYWPGKVEAPGAPGWRGTYPSKTLNSRSPALLGGTLNFKEDPNDVKAHNV